MGVNDDQLKMLMILYKRPFGAPLPSDALVFMLNIINLGDPNWTPPDASRVYKRFYTVKCSDPIYDRWRQRYLCDLESIDQPTGETQKPIDHLTTGVENLQLEGHVEQEPSLPELNADQKFFVKAIYKRCPPTLIDWSLLAVLLNLIQEKDDFRWSRDSAFTAYNKYCDFIEKTTKRRRIKSSIKKRLLDIDNYNTSNASNN